MRVWRVIWVVGERERKGREGEGCCASLLFEVVGGCGQRGRRRGRGEKERGEKKV